MQAAVKSSRFGSRCTPPFSLSLSFALQFCVTNPLITSSLAFIHSFIYHLFIYLPHLNTVGGSVSHDDVAGSEVHRHTTRPR